ncbi:tripartite tricarboxylate transporter permease [Paracoccus zhejiangensis]|uniref:C4-dicarboxylate ABC transporter permease n=1 Tax=Paracoccus zhejiangensis TaxID=1077935 RepID=A0A2H5F4N0_9RHOB|nr:tripartite tricarboxylate transporter permease [Paracoccus zhejiangensis]AUH66506.1 C4-dicarboxylate ABC transporter permease [Paracoccus zhejiangensis]
MDQLLTAAVTVFQPGTLAIIIGAAIYGLLIGAIPGLTATMGTALLVPITFFLDPIPAIGAIVTASAMAIFAGDIPGAMMRIPGTPASAAYTDEAYKMRKQGKLELALGVNLFCSALGGLIGVAVLIIGAPQIARFSLGFSSYEYFWLALLGLSCAVLVSNASPVKGLLALALGLFLSTIGIDVVMGSRRFTFGETPLIAGISIIPVLIGMFAIGEILRRMADPVPLPAVPPVRLGAMIRGVGQAMWRWRIGIARSSGIGAVIGALPGAGADIASWVTYALSKKFSREPQRYGTGYPEGIVNASAANNAALSGAYVPALVFGIPGDTITAILIGVLMMKGITPGPMVFVTNTGMVDAVFVIFILANLLIIPLGLMAVLAARRVMAVPQPVMFPAILLFCVIGAFASNNAVFDIWIMLGVGLLAFLLEENGFPLPPMILGLILGPLIEENMMQSLIKSNGTLLPFFERPIAGTLGVLTLIVWSAMAWSALRRRRTGTEAGA